MSVKRLFKHFIELASYIALQAPADFPVSLALGTSFLEVGLSARIVALPLDSHNVNRHVKMTHLEG